MLITPGYAALFALVFIVLSVRTLRVRHRLQVAIGDSNDPVLARAARVHANFAEYVPIALLLIYFLEIQGYDKLWIHGLLATLLAGRIVHAYGVSQVRENFRFRVTGMALTLIVLIVAPVLLLLAYL